MSQGEYSWYKGILTTLLQKICDTVEYNLNSSSIHASNKELYVEPNELAAKWAIGTKLAEAAVIATTQKVIRSAVHPIDRQFHTRNTALKYNSLNCCFTSDTFLASTLSILRTHALSFS
jgi:hypothetical protein